MKSQPPNLATYITSSSNIDRFSRFCHWHTLHYIC